MSMDSPQASATETRPWLVSHGFQVNYERGFTNGLAGDGRCPLLISSDQTDVRGLHPEVRVHNLRGSHDSRRSVWAKAFNLLRYHLRLCTLISRQRPAVVHVFGLPYPVLWVGVLEGLWLRIWAARYVLTVHDLLPHDHHTLAQTWWHRLAYRMAHHLVVHTPRMRDELIDRFGVLGHRITVMEHGVEPLPQPAESAPRPVTASFRLLAFGRIQHYKGIDVLLDALPLVREPVRLTLCGRCRDPALAKKIRERINALPAHLAVSWRNEYVSEAEVEGYFMAADGLALPYRHIDQSGVLLQALRFGVPVVATDVGPFSHYIPPQVGEICPVTDDPQAFAAAIDRLITRRPQLSSTAIRGLASAFEWAKVVQVLDQAYALPDPAAARPSGRGDPSSIA